MILLCWCSVEVGANVVYRKFCIDNPLCMRRFHLAYDDDDPKHPKQTEIHCPHCQVVVFKTNNPVRILREENLTKVSEFSDSIMRECGFKDKFV